jgi:hypothetical protein
MDYAYVKRVAMRVVDLLLNADEKTQKVFTANIDENSGLMSTDGALLLDGRDVTERLVHLANDVVSHNVKMNSEVVLGILIGKEMLELGIILPENFNYSFIGILVAMKSVIMSTSGDEYSRLNDRVKEVYSVLHAIENRPALYIISNLSSPVRAIQLFWSNVEIFENVASHAKVPETCVKIANLICNVADKSIIVPVDTGNMLRAIDACGKLL